jgi:hypothetical protein
MNQETAAAAVETPSSKVTVAFSDGQSFEFSPRFKSKKSVDAETKRVTFYVRNGALIEVDFDKIPQEVQLQLALHGIAQKVGDDAAGVEDPDDIASAFETMRDQLYAGQWSTERAKGEFTGVGMLVRAVAEVTSQPVDKVKARLAEMSATDKAQLKANAKVKAVIERMEAEKLAKAGPVDSEALLSSFGGEAA